MGIFTQTRPGIWQTSQPSQLPLGAFISSADTPLDHALGDLMGALPGVPLTVALTQQDSWFRPAPAASTALDILPYIETAWIDVKNDFDSYWSARGKNLRQNVKRQFAKLAADNTATRLEVVERAEDVAEAIEDYGRLESAGWKSEGGTAVHAQNAQGHFYRTMFTSLCDGRAARIYRYRLGDRRLRYGAALAPPGNDGTGGP